MVELVCSLHTSRENWEDGDTVMRIQLFSYVLSLCSQDNLNCQYVYRCHVNPLPQTFDYVIYVPHLRLSSPQGAAEAAALAELVPDAGRPEECTGGRCAPRRGGLSWS